MKYRPLPSYDVKNLILFKREDPAGQPVKNLPPEITPMPNWRFMLWHEAASKMELSGCFTAEDLRRLAAWMDSPDHPTRPHPIIDVKLSEL